MVHPMQYELERVYHTRCRQNAERTREALEAQLLSRESGIATPAFGGEVIDRIRQCLN